MERSRYRVETDRICMKMQVFDTTDTIEKLSSQHSTMDTESPGDVTVDKMVTHLIPVI